MNYKKAIEPVTVLKAKPAELIERARETGQPIVITQRGKATAILQDVESFQRQQETLLLLKLVSQGSEEVRRGKGVPHDAVVRRMRRKLHARGNG